MKINQIGEYTRRLVKPVVFEVFRWMQHKQSWITFEHLNIFSIVLENLNAAKKGNVTFVQVGAYDGRVADPLYESICKFNWRGLLVEPQAVPFSALCKLYQGKNMVFENSAIANSDGVVKMFVDHSAPTECSMIKKSFGDSFTVNAVTFETLLKKHNFGTDLDLLQIDVEGLDDMVIYQALKLCRPRVIHFESFFLSILKTKKLFNFLNDKGYRIYNGPIDTIAML